ncbi:hypothetical protein ALC62_09846 [Cyphomyrmex costatus]|uniref:Tesmin/TSO1-like CXC domain-containing protein n=1 Tax=Cyphomyrmex costatus TaxID=456900 RepID=A0A151IEY1_9HYME|nr:hypothetical protein ALC62_09846 [Cyphomyrmex costatus]
MGGIVVATPSSSVTSKTIISRLKDIPSSEAIGKTGFIELKHFEKRNSDGLKTVLIEDIFNDDTDDYETSSLDFTWSYSKFVNKKSDGWNGFMEKSHCTWPYSTLKIIPLPFINNPPTDFDTIFTSLVEAANKCQNQEQKFVFVTFDQPLYYKACEILASVNPENDPYNLSSVIARLGGFHLLMSFLGSIGFIMDGSGLKEAFCEIYAENSADKALSGHAYSRAIRRNFLIQLALSNIIFSSMDFTDTEKALLDGLLVTLGTRIFQETLQQEDFKRIKTQFLKHLKSLKTRYELAPFPLSLFTENGLRKNIKSQLYDEFTTISVPTYSNSVVHVVDGGFLLHKVIWQKNDTVEEIINKYLNYVRNNYAVNSYIVFDGYPDLKNTATTAATSGNSTKKAERIRRKTSEKIPEFNYQDHTRIPFLPQKFLSNERNKDNIIKSLSTKLKAEGYFCKQADEDADAVIINTALDVAECDDKTVIVVGQDIDLLVLLNLLNTNNYDIYFLKPGSGNAKDSMYTSDSFKHVTSKNIVAFLYCFSGCDTTSGFTGKGKKTTVKSLLANKKLSGLAQIFYRKDANKTDVAKSGSELIKSIYKCNKEDVTLNQLRYQNYQAAAVKSSFKLEKLPPTEDAAKQHCYRAYYQLQTWLGNVLTATDWGWKKYEHGIMPEFTKKDLIPEMLLKTICCSCETGCNNKKCGCKKHGLKCTHLCTNCDSSEKCSNYETKSYEDLSNNEEIHDDGPNRTKQNVGFEDDDDHDEDPTDSDSFYESGDEELPSKRPKLV